MSASNGRLLASPTSGRLLFKAATGRLIYAVAEPEDYVYTLDTYLYNRTYSSALVEAHQDFSDFDYWYDHRQELRDALDAATRPSFLAASLSTRQLRFATVAHSDSNLPNDGRRNEVQYTSICIPFSTSSVPAFASITHAVLDIACGRTFAGADADDFDDSFYAVGMFATSASAASTVADIIQSPHFRLNIGDCQRQTAQASSVGYCIPRQSGYALTNDYIPVLSVSIDDALTYLRTLSNPSTLYLYLAIDGPCHIPVVSGFRRSSVVASPNAIHLYA